MAASTVRLAIELAHEPDPEVEAWQESLVLVWYDDEQGVGGYHRVGHLPNRGTSNVWCGIFTSAGHRYRSNVEDLTLRPEDREPPIYRAGVQTFSFEDRMRLAVEDEGVAAQLEVEDFLAPDDVWEHVDRTEIEAQTAANHNEAAGRVRGTIRLGDQEWTVDGLCHRDHSWGPREWNQIAAHRWIAGCCGPDLAFTLVQLIGRDGRPMFAASVLDDGRMRRSNDVEVVTHLDFDGLSGRGGSAIARFDDGGPELRLECEGVRGFTFTMDDFKITDLISRVTTSDGRTGFCDFEYSNNRRNHDVGVETELVEANGLTVGR